MVESIETIVTQEVKVNNRGSEVIPWEETLASMEKKSVEYSLERRKSLQARYIYGFLFLLTNLMAWFMRDYGHKVLFELHCKSRVTIFFFKLLVLGTCPNQNWFTC